MEAPQRRSPEAVQPENDPGVIIALMGETGVGKTSFIRRVTGDRSIRPNHTLTPQGSAVVPHTFLTPSRDGNDTWKITIIDCPGFDEMDAPDNNIIKSILEYLRRTYEQHQRLHGIIYMLDISKTRIINDAFANINMFKRLVGDDYYRNVVLGTTFWDTLTSKERGEAREAEFMREDALWADLIQGQSKVMRLGFQAADGDLPTFAKDAISPSETDLNVLLEICENHQSEALCAQREMDQGLNSGETSAVRELNEWRQRARQHQERRAQIQERIREQLASNNMRFGQQLEEECLRMDQIYEQQTREFAVDQARLRESRHQIQSLMQERSADRRQA